MSDQINKNELSAKADIINAITNVLVANKNHLGTYYELRDLGVEKLIELISSIKVDPD